MRKVARRLSQGKLTCKRKETGSPGIDFGTGGAKATAVVARLIVSVTADVPLNTMEAGVAVQFAPVGRARVLGHGRGVGGGVAGRRRHDREGERDPEAEARPAGGAARQRRQVHAVFLVPFGPRLSVLDSLVEVERHVEPLDQARVLVDEIALDVEPGIIQLCPGDDLEVVPSLQVVGALVSAARAGRAIVNTIKDPARSPASLIFFMNSLPWCNLSRIVNRLASKPISDLDGQCGALRGNIVVTFITNGVCSRPDPA